MATATRRPSPRNCGTWTSSSGSARWCRWTRRCSTRTAAPSPRLRDYFVNDAGEPVPVLLNLGYYDCPLQCIPIRTGIADAARQAAVVPGVDYRIVSISINPEETPAVANLYRQRAVKRMNRLDATDASWAFLAGQEVLRPADRRGCRLRLPLPARRRPLGARLVHHLPLAGRRGGRRRRGPRHRHRYLNGTKYPPQQFGLAVQDASTGSLGSPFSGIIAWCYQFSGAHGKYVIVAKRVMALGGLVVVGVLAVVVGFLFKWERARHARLREEDEAAASV